MGLVRIRKFSYIFSIILVAASIVSLAFYGLKFGIDFTGGSLIEAQFDPTGGGRPDINIVRQKMEALDFGQVVSRPGGGVGFWKRPRGLSTEERKKITGNFRAWGKLKT